jgi:hypothetical protein
LDAIALGEQTEEKRRGREKAQGENNGQEEELRKSLKATPSSIRPAESQAGCPIWSRCHFHADRVTQEKCTVLGCRMPQLPL